MPICPRCGSAVGSDAQFCSNCGAPLNVSSENFCTNPDCKRHKEHFSFAPGVRFCDQCGKLTTDGKKIEALILASFFSKLLLVEEAESYIRPTCAPLQ